MSEISTIIIETLNQEKYDKLISYIEKAGTIKWRHVPIEGQIYRFESTKKRNSPFYMNIKITVNPTDGDRKEEKERIRKSLKGLVDLLS